MAVPSLGLMGVSAAMAGSSIFAPEAARQCAKPAVQLVLDRLKERVRGILAAHNQPEREIDPALLRDQRISSDAEVAKLTEEFVGHYPSIRRARIVARFLKGAKILWVDDQPRNNVNEIRVLEQFGIQMTTCWKTSARSRVSPSQQAPCRATLKSGSSA
jgi:hypothetical protein